MTGREVVERGEKRTGRENGLPPRLTFYFCLSCYGVMTGNGVALTQAEKTVAPLSERTRKK